MSDCKGHEKLWLEHLSKHLSEYASMRNPFDSRAFIVSLSQERIRPDHPYTWIDVVEQDDAYFHPYGKRWPVISPAYIGFRYNGQLQHVRYVRGRRIVEDLVAINDRWPVGPRPHCLYALGPPLQPRKPVSSKGLHRGARLWGVAIDLLLSGECATISEANDLTQLRSVLNDAGVTPLDEDEVFGRS